MVHGMPVGCVHVCAEECSRVPGYTLTDWSCPTTITNSHANLPYMCYVHVLLFTLLQQFTHEHCASLLIFCLVLHLFVCTVKLL